MSITMPLGSRCPAMKAARTTKVAPCNCWAGPNTAPWNEWAIMIWSDTSTANTGTSRSVGGRRIADQRATRVRLRSENLNQSLRQIFERHRRRQQAVEDRIGEQLEGRGQTARSAPADPVRGRDPAALGRTGP